MNQALNVVQDHQPEMANLIGHLIGAVGFGSFVLTLWTERRRRYSWTSEAAVGCAAIVLAWNVFSLLGEIVPPPRLAAVCQSLSFSALTLLPASLLQISLKGRLKSIVVAGYVLGLSNALLHTAVPFVSGTRLQDSVFLCSTVGFSVLTIVALIGLEISSPKQIRAQQSRALAAMSAALVALSFVHLLAGHRGESWERELVLHHAGVPIAMFVILQEYRFVLFDAFVRSLTTATMATVMAVAFIKGIVLLGVPMHLVERDEEVFVIFLLTALLAGFSSLRSLLQQLLSRIFFRQPAIEELLSQVTNPPVLFPHAGEYLHWAASEIAQSMRAEEFSLLSPEMAGDATPLRISGPTQITPELLGSTVVPQWAHVAVSLSLANREVWYLFLGRRKQGRLYLSEDMHSLERLVSAVVQLVERFRTEHSRTLLAQAELKALQAQINPHFLFNALNTIYGLIPPQGSVAREAVTDLADIFRYYLRTDKSLVPLKEELALVNAYLQITKLRVGPRLSYEQEIAPQALNLMVPVLSLQPLIENAVKHGISKHHGPAVLRLAILMRGEYAEVSISERGGAEDNGGPSGLPTSTKPDSNGVGIANVASRLKFHYGQQAEIRLDTWHGGSTVQFRIPCAVATQQAPTEAN